jgi:hypothetical protein
MREGMYRFTKEMTDPEVVALILFLPAMAAIFILEVRAAVGAVVHAQCLRKGNHLRRLAE